MTDGQIFFQPTHFGVFFRTSLSLETEEEAFGEMCSIALTTTPFFRCENDSLGGAIWRVWPKRIQNARAPNLFSKLEGKSPKKM